MNRAGISSVAAAAVVLTAGCSGDSPLSGASFTGGSSAVESHSDSSDDLGAEARRAYETLLKLRRETSGLRRATGSLEATMLVPELFDEHGAALEKIAALEGGKLFDEIEPALVYLGLTQAHTAPAVAEALARHSKDLASIEKKLDALMESHEREVSDGAVNLLCALRSK